VGNSKEITNLSREFGEKVRGRPKQKINQHIKAHDNEKKSREEKTWPKILWRGRRLQAIGKFEKKSLGVENFGGLYKSSREKKKKKPKQSRREPGNEKELEGHFRFLMGGMPKD